MEVPTVEIRFQNLKVAADVQVGSRSLPTLLNFTYDVFEVEFLFSLIFSSLRIISPFVFHPFFVDLIFVFGAEYTNKFQNYEIQKISINHFERS